MRWPWTEKMMAESSIVTAVQLEQSQSITGDLAASGYLSKLAAILSALADISRTALDLPASS